MNVFFEESGDFKAGHIMTQQGEAFQVELTTGRRAKVRAKEVYFQFATPSPEQLLDEAQSIATEIDLDFLWEVAGTEEFAYVDLATEYFGHEPTPTESAALILRLHGAPFYFHKKGRGRYKAAPEEALKAALAGIEKKKQQAAIQSQYVESLKAGELPESMRASVRHLLFKPDKNSLEYKALDTACNELQISPSRLMLKVGGVRNPRELHMMRFLMECFPKGTGFPSVSVPNVGELPFASVQAFSIDDVTTTEIDDAFSVTPLDDTRVCIGIHIAAPGLAIRRDDAIDAIARHRLSTVYMPGDKITMLPDSVVESYTLAEGRDCPALSLYATVSLGDWQVLETTTRAERIRMAANLRHNDLDELVTEAALADGSGDYAHKQDIAVLWQWAQRLEQTRMEKRAAFGLKPEHNNRTDFNFYVEDDVVSIVKRKRGAPLDKIVAELMIFANSTWGKLMHDCGVPGIYRTQQPAGGWGNKMQVRMLTHAAPHQGLGVDQYAWSTSPLRRYTDLVNQWQILACAEKGVMAPLVAPFKPRDADLFAIVSAFDAAYTSYGDFQSHMERFWCLRWLAQQQLRQAEAVVLKDEVVRLVDIPLIIRIPGMPTLARGTHVKLDLPGWDDVDLTVEARLLEVENSVDSIDDEELEDSAENSESNEGAPASDTAETADAPAGSHPAAGSDHAPVIDPAHNDAGPAASV